MDGPGSSDSHAVTGYVVEQDNAMPSNHQTVSGHSHTTAEQALEEIDRASMQKVTTEPTSCGGGDHRHQEEDTRQENSDRMDSEMTVFRSSDVVDQNVNPGALLAELTKESPPSYESVVKASVIQIPPEKASTYDNGTNVITTQPQSSTISQPAVDDNANSNVVSQSAAEVDSITAQHNEYLGHEYTPDSRTCCTSTSCCLSDCCDACTAPPECENCCSSEDMECFCEVSYIIGLIDLESLWMLM